MKNILLILPYGGVGGMERVALNFYYYYKNKGYNVKAIKLIGLDSDIIKFNEDEYVFSNKDLNQMLPIQRLWFYILAPFKLKKIIKNNKITHSIAFGDVPNLFSALSFTKEIKIGSIHSFKSVELKSHSFLNTITKYGYRTFYKNFNKVVCISMATKIDLIEKCNYKFESNLQIIYNPHDLNNIIKLGNAELTIQKEKEIFKKDIVLFLGRLSAVKAPWHLINAFAQLKDKTNTNLVFVGDGDDLMNAYLQKLIEHHGLKDRVFFLGRKSNPYKYLSKAKVLALCSYYEGTPNVIVEAIALNVPVVSTNCSHGIKELMSINQDIPSCADNIFVEGGIICPNMFKEKIELPNQIFDITEKEIKYASALENTLNNNHFKENVTKHSAKLTQKFNQSIVCDMYI